MSSAKMAAILYEDHTLLGGQGFCIDTGPCGQVVWLIVLKVGSWPGNADIWEQRFLEPTVDICELVFFIMKRTSYPQSTLLKIFQDVLS